MAVNYTTIRMDLLLRDKLRMVAEPWDVRQIAQDNSLIRDICAANRIDIHDQTLPEKTLAQEIAKAISQELTNLYDDWARMRGIPKSPVVTETVEQPGRQIGQTTPESSE